MIIAIPAVNFSRAKLCAGGRCHAHFRLHRHRLSDCVHTFSGDEITLGRVAGLDRDRYGGRGASCSTRRNAIIASAESRSDIAAAKPSGPRVRAIARPRRRAGGSTEHPGLGSAPSQADAPILLSLSLHRWRFRTLDLHAMWRAPRAIGRARPFAETVLKRWRRCTGHFREAYRLHSYSGKGCQPRFFMFIPDRFRVRFKFTPRTSRTTPF
jgi:hypothetical protein